MGFSSNVPSKTKLKDEEVRSKAIAMLARRSLTKKELKERLIKKGATAIQAVGIVEDFTRKGYIDEDSIIEDAIRLSRESKLIGRFKLRFELKKRGIGQEIIETRLSLAYPESDEYPVAMKFAERKVSSYSGISNEKRYRRLSAALNRRGFQADVIRKTLSDLDIDPFDD